MGETRLILTDGAGRQLDDHIDAWSATRRCTLDDHVWTDDLDLEATSQGVDKGRYVIGDVDGEWREWRVSSPDEIREDTRPRCDVACVDSLRELAVTRHIEHFHETSVTPRRALELVLQDTRWTVGEVPDMDPTDLELDAVDGWAALTTIAGTFGLEIWSTMSPDSGLTRISERRVHMAVRRGDVSGRRFDYASNLTRIRRTFDASEVATRIIPLGKQVETTDGAKSRVTIAQANQGSIWLDTEDTELASRWSVADATGALAPACMIIVHDDIEDPGLLRNAGLKDLESHSRPSVSYEATVTDWTMAGLDAARLHAGDTIQIVDSSFAPALRLEGRVTGIETDLLAGPDESTVTVGDITQGISMTRTIAVDTAATVAAGKPVWDAGAADASTAITTASAANGVATGAAAGADSALQAAANAVSTALDAQETANGLDGRLTTAETVIASLPGTYQPKGDYLTDADIAGLLSADDVKAGENVTVEKGGDGSVTINATGGVTFDWEPISAEEIRMLVWGTPGRPVPLVNAGFETGDLTGWTVTGDAKIDGDQGDTAAQGSHYAYLGSTGTLKQSASITGGSMYRASCALMNRGTARTMGFRLSFDAGDPVQTVIPCRSAGLWERPKLVFKAPPDCSTVTFEPIGGPYNRVDDVSITPITRGEDS